MGNLFGVRYGRCRKVVWGEVWLCGKWYGVRYGRCGELVRGEVQKMWGSGFGEVAGKAIKEG